MTKQTAALLKAHAEPEQTTPSFLTAASSQDEIVAAMPASARELVEIIGFLPTLEVLRKFGGKRVFIPSKLNDDSRIIAELGREVAEKLVARMGGARFEPPMLTSVERRLRDNAIRRDFDARVPMDDLVDRYRMTQRHIRKLLNASTATEPAQRPERARDRFTRDLFAHQLSTMGVAA